MLTLCQSCFLVFASVGIACSSTGDPAFGALGGGSRGGAESASDAGVGKGPRGGSPGNSIVAADAGGSGEDGVAAGPVARDAGSAKVGSDGGPPPGDPGALGDGDITMSAPYNVQPDLTDLGAPKGKSFQFTMDSTKSVIFDGSDKTLDPAKTRLLTRAIDVYVPNQYKDGTPAPILVIQDGRGPIDMVARALDNLTISNDPQRKLPAFIAIAIQNGGDDSKGSERGLEYDTMSDRYARFVQTEVLPAVLADSAIRQAYPNLSFTNDPEGRGTLGCSSGAAAALIMAWFRPDLFRRVITYSGTFVAQQNDTAPEQALYPLGAWDFHSEKMLIANSTAKPLRVFLNVNENDNGATAPESGHHNWVIANQRTAAALQGKGYHSRFVFAKGLGHCDGRAQSSTLADTLVWSWRGYPGAP